MLEICQVCALLYENEDRVFFICLWFFIYYKPGAPALPGIISNFCSYFLLLKLTKHYNAMAICPKNH